MRPRPLRRVASQRVALAALVTAAVAALAACGGSEDEAGASPTTAPPPAETAASPETSPPAESQTGAATDTGAAAAPEPVTDYLAYVGGTAGAADASLEPVVIGWVNGQGGQINDFWQPTKAVEAFVEYANAELGGVGGHPLELHECFIAQAEEEGQKCGQEMTNDDQVMIVGIGSVAVGAQTLHATIAGAKPIVAGVSQDPSTSVADNTYALFGDSTSVSKPNATYARDVLHAKTAALVYPSQAGATFGADAMREGLEEAGIDVKAVGYDPQATDLVGPLTAAGALDADVILSNVDLAGCVLLAKALDQMGNTKPVLSNPLCLAPPVMEGLGGDFAPWTYSIAQSLPLDPSSPDSVAYVQTSGKYGLDQETAGNVFAGVAWAQMMAILKFMNAVGYDNLSPETLAEQAKAFTGPVVMGAPEIQCGKYPETQAVCNDQVRFYNYEGKGVFELASDWLRPPLEAD